MDPHAHFNRCRRPCFVLQGALRRQCGSQGIVSGVKGSREEIADDLEYETVM